MEQGRFYPVANEGVSRRVFGADASRVGIITIDLSVARTKEKIQIGGTFLWAESATSRSANLGIAFAPSAVGVITFKEGKAIGGLAFSEVYLTNAAQAGETITLVYITEDETFRIENAGALFTSVSLSKSTVLDSVADVAIGAGLTVSLKAADSTRRKIIVTNLIAGAEVRIGDSGAGAANGIPLQPGESIELETTDAVFGFSTAGSTVAVLVTKD